MKTVLAWRMTGIGLALLLASSACLAIETITSRHIESTALVFKQTELSSPLFPASVHTRNLPTVFSSQLKFSCLGVRSGRNGVLVYLPELNRCLSLDKLQRVERTGQANRSGFGQEERLLLAKLESSLLIVMQPMALPTAIEGACICPDVKPLELIFFDSFELGL